MPAKYTPEKRMTAFWAKVNKSGPVPEYAPELGPCWLWLAGRHSAGYGYFGVGRRMVLAHRYAYQETRGPIPEGLEIDHLCRVRHCVNHEHLEPVIHRVNILRGVGLTAREAKVTHCPQGHAYDEANTRSYRGGRRCRECQRVWDRAYYARKGAVARA